MHLVTSPVFDGWRDGDALALGKFWGKLDSLCAALGIETLSSFVALPDEGDAGDVAAARMLPSITALVEAVNSPGNKFPGKRGALAVLAKLRDAAVWLSERDGRERFEVDL